MDTVDAYRNPRRAAVTRT